MNTLYIILQGKIDDTTTSACKEGINFLLRTNVYQNLEIQLNCNGGDVLSTEELANFLKGIELPITTWNTGSVESSAQLIYSLGNPRYTDMGGMFLFHKAVALSLPDDLQIGQNVWDYKDYLEQQQTRYIAQVVSGNVTNTNFDKQTILSWMTEGIRFGAQGALELGYANEIKTPTPLNPLSNVCWVDNNLVLVMSGGKSYHKLYRETS